MKERISFYPKPWIEHCREQAMLVPVEIRQKFIDCVWHKHMTIGDAGKECDLNFDEYSGIMNMQIKSASYFDTVAIARTEGDDHA